MRVAVISDEISDDLEEAIELGTLLGVDTFELRWLQLDGGPRRRVGELTELEATRLAKALGRGGARVSAISPGAFSASCASRGEAKAELERLERTLALAGLLGTRAVIIRGFAPPDGRKSDVCPGAVIDVLGEAARRAREAGCQLLLRNIAGGYADTGAHTASILHAVRSEALGVSWDPCHAQRMGEASMREGYEWVAPFVRDVRVKDQVRHQDLGYEYTLLGQGGLDWPAQLQALAESGYQGTVTLGMQLEPRVLNTMHCLEALRGMLAQVQS